MSIIRFPHLLFLPISSKVNLVVRFLFLSRMKIQSQNLIHKLRFSRYFSWFFMLMLWQKLRWQGFTAYKRNGVNRRGAYFSWAWFSLWMAFWETFLGWEWIFGELIVMEPCICRTYTWFFKRSDVCNRNQRIILRIWMWVVLGILATGTPKAGSLKPIFPVNLQWFPSLYQCKIRNIATKTISQGFYL